MGSVMRSCIQSILKLVNCVVGMVGIAMVLYSVWLIIVWQREMGDFPFFDDDDDFTPCDDDYASDRVPLLKDVVYPPPYVVGKPVMGSRNDAWSIRINEKDLAFGRLGSEMSQPVYNLMSKRACTSAKGFKMEKGS
ncbi:unnamed protein product [Dovyalis caffra]|uniref:Uncharacterized protein n=1 Tax=Dovyalis caffra TaxID=77055 RepID=A0AAV1SGD0_9ROSI|nr:unnamed protein product [Dovyalis caffra]